MEAEMDGGVWVSESPLATLKGGDQQLPWPVAAGHCSGQPDGAARNNSDDGAGDGLTLFCDAWKRRPLSRAGTPK